MKRIVHVQAEPISCRVGNVALLARVAKLFAEKCRIGFHRTHQRGPVILNDIHKRFTSQLYCISILGYYHTQ